MMPLAWSEHTTPGSMMRGPPSSMACWCVSSGTRAGSASSRWSSSPVVLCLLMVGDMGSL